MTPSSSRSPASAGLLNSLSPRVLSFFHLQLYSPFLFTYEHIASFLAQVSVNRKMDKQTMAHLYNGVVLNKKE